MKCLQNKQKLLLLAPLELDEGRNLKEKLIALQSQGYARIKVKGVVDRIETFLETDLEPNELQLVVDRIIVRHEKDFYNNTDFLFYSF